ncbi:DNA-binding response regulator [bacterium CG_4_9_14_3_um_filter_65_15]|nr:MAG: DNA-binding response regulator [bacterium CG_4_9_14_3_um_filter_65_15]
MNIVLADDHTLVLEGLRRCFDADPEFDVCGTAADGDELVKLVARIQPDIALVDITMPKLNGIEAIRAITHLPDNRTRCVVVSMHRERDFVATAFKNGARGYLMKSASFEELKDALVLVMQGPRYVGERVADVLGPDDSEGQVTGPPILNRLTPRERQTLQLLAEGLSVKEIGAKLGISHKTVHTFRASLMRKLECGSVADLTRLAIRMGLTNLN